MEFILSLLYIAFLVYLIFKDRNEPRCPDSSFYLMDAGFAPKTKEYKKWVRDGRPLLPAKRKKTWREKMDECAERQKEKNERMKAKMREDKERRKRIKAKKKELQERHRQTLAAQEAAARAEAHDGDSQ